MSKAINKLITKMNDVGLSDGSIKLYLQRLTKLNGDKPPKSFLYLKKVEDIMERMNDLKKNTKESYLGSIITILKLLPKKTYEPSLNKYKNRLEILRGEIKEEPKSTSETITKEKLDKLKEEYMEGSRAITGKTIGKKDYNLIIHNLLLSLYTDIPPRRNQDFLFMKITDDYDKEADKNDFNWYDKKNKRFIFNKYKTAKSYGEQVIDIKKNKSLLSALKIYLKYRKQNENWLLVKWSGENYKQVNDITRELHKVFGEKVGSTKLRHLYVSDKYGEINKEQQADAKAMGHSVSTQQSVYNDN